jgi:hypothetical protein
MIKGFDAGLYPINKRKLHSPGLTFHPLLFNLWGRCLLKLEPCFSGIPASQAKSLFRRMRAGSEFPPFQMHDFKEAFIGDFTAYALNFEPKATLTLKETLSLIWQEFVKEYEWVSIDDLDGRFSRCVTIETNIESPAQQTQH